MPGTPRYTYQDGYKQGLAEAAKLLTRTAQDYDQMAAQEQASFEALAKNRWLQAVNHRQRVADYSGKAQLLRGQAKLIAELKP